MTPNGTSDSSSNETPLSSNKNSHSTNNQQNETFLFLYRRDHTAFITLVEEIPSSAFAWQQSDPFIKITMMQKKHRSQTPDGRPDTESDENTCWEWLRKNIKGEKVTPPCPPQNSNIIIIDSDDANDVAELKERDIKETKNEKINDVRFSNKKESRALVVALAQQGYKAREIAERTQVSLRKVEYYVGKTNKMKELHKTKSTGRTLKIGNTMKFFSNDALTELAMKMKRQGCSFKYIAERFKMKRSALLYYVSKYKKFGTTEPVIQPPRKKLNQQHIDFLVRLLENKDRPMGSISEIRANFESQFGLKVSHFLMYRTVRSLGYSRKKARLLPGDRNSKRMIELRKKIVMQMISKWDSNKIPIFIDETGFQNAMFSGHLYSKVGEFVYRKSSVVNTTMIRVILAITQDAFLGYQCFKGGITASDFYGFLSGLLIHNQDIHKRLEDYVFVLDNAAAHKHQDYHQFREYLDIVYLPPYSPFLNPIEHMFGEWKRQFRGKPFRGLSDVLNSIHSTFKQLDYSLLPKVYAHSLTFYPKCLKGVPIE